MSAATLAALPWAWLAAALSFAAAVAAAEGHWPAYSHPDPKHAGALSALYPPVMYLLLAALAAPIAIAVLFGGRMLMRRAIASLARPALVLLLGWALVVCVFAANPLGLGSWLLD